MPQSNARKPRGRGRHAKTIPMMSEIEFASLGDGEVAYIKVLTTKQARAMFPAIEGLPRNTSLFSLHGADGTPIALTDSIQAALGHAMDDELAIASLH